MAGPRKASPQEGREGCRDAAGGGQAATERRRRPPLAPPLDTARCPRPQPLQRSPSAPPGPGGPPASRRSALASQVEPAGPRSQPSDALCSPKEKAPGPSPPAAVRSDSAPPAPPVVAPADLGPPIDPATTPGYSLGYRGICILGRGSFGTALLVQNRKGERRAMKAVDVSCLSAEEEELAEYEAEILSTLKHPYIIRYHEHFREGSIFAIVMDFAQAGNLLQRITITRLAGEALLESQIVRWTTQATLALKYLHGEGIIHRDLKSENFFLTSNYDVLMGDFGLSERLPGEGQGRGQGPRVLYEDKALGTPYYFSPEICTKGRYSCASDMWALGVVIFEMAALRVPFDAHALPALVVKILTGRTPALPETYSEELRGLVACLLQRDYKSRLTCAEILKSPAVRTQIKFLLTEARGQASQRKEATATAEMGDKSSRHSRDSTPRPKLNLLALEEIAAAQVDAAAVGVPLTPRGPRGAEEGPAPPEDHGRGPPAAAEAPRQPGAEQRGPLAMRAASARARSGGGGGGERWPPPTPRGGVPPRGGGKSPSPTAPETEACQAAELTLRRPLPPLGEAKASQSPPRTHRSRASSARTRPSALPSLQEEEPGESQCVQSQPPDLEAAEAQSGSVGREARERSGAAAAAGALRRPLHEPQPVRALSRCQSAVAANSAAVNRPKERRSSHPAGPPGGAEIYSSRDDEKGRAGPARAASVVDLVAPERTLAPMLAPRGRHAGVLAAAAREGAAAPGTAREQRKRATVMVEEGLLRVVACQVASARKQRLP